MTPKMAAVLATLSLAGVGALALPVLAQTASTSKNPIPILEQNEYKAMTQTRHREREHHSYDAVGHDDSGEHGGGHGGDHSQGHDSHGGGGHDGGGESHGGGHDD